MTTSAIHEQATHAGEFRSDSAPAFTGEEVVEALVALTGELHPLLSGDDPAWAHAGLSPFCWKDPTR
ncbi:hypothetical protein ACLMAL_32255 [Nocardia sp. CWNU-33]|uniref:hypothetical protein n=1 Tax=Nocardia sp. CWNU-33 TaxID=3392117 RepID=UPI00398E672D